MKYLIEVSIEDEEETLGMCVEAIATELMQEDDLTEGPFTVGLDGPTGCFRLIELPRRDIVPDRRQRVAAAQLLMGYDLPVELGDHAAQMLFASLICPGMTTADLPTRQSRIEVLDSVREMVDAMIEEIGAVRAGELHE